MSSHGNSHQRTSNSRGQPTNAALAARSVRTAVQGQPAVAPGGQGSTHITPEARTALEGAFGSLSDRTIRAMAGALPSGSVLVTTRPSHGAGGGVRVTWHVNGPALPAGQKHSDTDHQQYVQLRHIDIAANGQIGPMHNADFEIAPGYRKTGLGVASFTAQVQTLSHLGVRSITTYAGKMGDAVHGFEMNGFYTWPRLGYNAALPQWQIENALKTPTIGSRAGLGQTPANRRAYRQNTADRFNLTPLAPQTKARLAALQQMGRTPTIQDLFRTPDGAEWWKYHGDAQEMVFNLQPGSIARRRLADYLRARRNAGRPLLNPATFR